MKKLFDYVFTAVVVGAIGFLIYLIINCPAKGQDCAVTTILRILPNQTYTNVARAVHNDKYGATIPNIIKGYNELSTNKLLCFCSAFPSIVPLTTNRIHVQAHKPYLWCGIRSGTNGHCALLEFELTNVVLSSSEFYIGTTNYVVDKFDYDWFYTHTYTLWDSADLTPNIRFY